jgi:hypothetical protein
MPSNSKTELLYMGFIWMVYQCKTMNSRIENSTAKIQSERGFPEYCRDKGLKRFGVASCPFESQ